MFHQNLNLNFRLIRKGIIRLKELITHYTRAPGANNCLLNEFTKMLNLIEQHRFTHHQNIIDEADATIVIKSPDISIQHYSIPIF